MFPVWPHQFLFQLAPERGKSQRLSVQCSCQPTPTAPERELSRRSLKQSLCRLRQVAALQEPSQKSQIQWLCRLSLFALDQKLLRKSQVHWSFRLAPALERPQPLWNLMYWKCCRFVVLNSLRLELGDSGQDP